MVDNDDNMESGSLSMIRHKIVFVGDVAVGKTSIIFRFIENKFVDNYEVRISNLNKYLNLFCSLRSVLISGLVH